jgi:hypothetical protein
MSKYMVVHDDNGDPNHIIMKPVLIMVKEFKPAMVTSDGMFVIHHLKVARVVSGESPHVYPGRKSSITNYSKDCPNMSIPGAVEFDSDEDALLWFRLR